MMGNGGAGEAHAPADFGESFFNHPAGGFLDGENRFGFSPLRGLLVDGHEYFEPLLVGEGLEDFRIVRWFHNNSIAGLRQIVKN